MALALVTWIGAGVGVGVGPALVAAAVVRDEGHRRTLIGRGDTLMPAGWDPWGPFGSFDQGDAFLDVLDWRGRKLFFRHRRIEEGRE